MAKLDPLPGQLALDGIWEVFNVFNRPNCQLGNQESASDYLAPVNGQSGSMQLAFRLTF